MASLTGCEEWSLLVDTGVIGKESDIAPAAGLRSEQVERLLRELYAPMPAPRSTELVALHYPAGAGASWFGDATTTPCFCIAFAIFLLTSETMLLTLFGSIVLLSAE